MTFLNPLVLLGLAAAALPVLFHLFAQRRARKVEFSSLQFLRKMEKTSMRAVKIRQILLLVIRTLLVICLVMAFARPAIQGYLGSVFGSSHAASSVVILIDNSATLSRSNERGELFAQSKAVAREIVMLMREGDEGIVLPLGSLERGKDHQPVHSQSELLAALDAITVVDRPASVEDGLRIAGAILAQSQNVNKEVFLVSDGQATNFGTGILAADSVRRTDTSATLKFFDASTKVFYSIVRPSELSQNLSLDSIKTLTTVFEPGRPVEFVAFVRNTGEQPVQNAVVSLFYNDERVAQRTLDLVEPGTTERVSIQGPARGAGVLSVRAELGQDGLPFDNKRFTVVTLPATRRIAMYLANPGDATFVRLALEQSLSEVNTLPFSVETRSLNDLEGLPAMQSRLDAVMIGVGSQLPSASEVQALRTYLQSGRGATVFFMPGVDVARFNAEVAAALGLPQIRAKEGSALENSRYVSFAQVDFAHPFFGGLFMDRTGETQTIRGIESPKIYEYYSVAQTGLALIRLSSGNTFLGETQAGKGTVIYFTVPPTLAFSDFPTKSIFLPLIRRAAAYTSAIRGQSDENRDQQFVTTEPLTISLPELEGEQPGSTVMIKLPDGSTVRTPLQGSREGRLQITLDQAPLAGNYTVFRDAEGKEMLTVFPVNIASNESDLREASDSDVQTYLEQRSATPRNVRALTAGRDVAKAVTASRFGSELWQAFLAAALVLAIAEMLIARIARSEVA